MSTTLRKDSPRLKYTQPNEESGEALSDLNLVKEPLSGEV
jgi:hypothetical protein